MAAYWDGQSTSSRDALSAILPYLFLSREDDDDVRYNRKHDFRSVPLHPKLPNPNPKEEAYFSLRNRHFVFKIAAEVLKSVTEELAHTAR